MLRAPINLRTFLLPLAFGSAMYLSPYTPNALLVSQCVPAKDAGNNPLTLHTAAHAVLVDVVVRDKTATALPEASFQIFEDGKPQKIASFAFHASPQHQLPSSASLGLFDPVGAERSNLQAAPRDAPIAIILLDTLNTSIVDQQRSRKQVIAALGALPAGQSVALFTLGTTLQMIQDFSGKSDVLVAAAGKMNARLSPLYIEHGPDQVREDDSLSGADFQKEHKALMLSAIQDPQEKVRVASEEIDKALAERGTRRIDQRVDSTFSAIAHLAQAVQSFPGRKKLIWISGSLPLTLRPDAGTGYDPNLVRDYAPKLHALEAALSNAQIAVYTMDARGLMTLGIDASVAGSDITGMHPGQAPSNLYGDREQDSVHSTQATLMELAQNTGGRSFLNENNLAPAMRDAMLDGTSYYSLSYQPSGVNFDGKYRSIEVKVDAVKRSELQYRKGYYALPEPANNPDKAKALFVAAMQKNAPVATEVTFKASLVHATSTTETALDYLIDISNLSLRDSPDCGKQLNLVIGAVAWKPSDAKAATGFKTYNQVLTPEAFSAAQNSGLHVRQSLANSADRTFFKLGVLDLTTGHMGTLNYPLKDDPLPSHP